MNADLVSPECANGACSDCCYEDCACECHAPFCDYGHDEIDECDQCGGCCECGTCYCGEDAGFSDTDEDFERSAGGEMTLDEIYAIPADGNGWRILPNGNYLHIGTNVKTEIDLAKLGSYAVIGQGAVIGSGAQIGRGAKIGSYAQIGRGAKIGSYAQIGRGAKIVEKQMLLTTPLAVQGSQHLAGNYQPGMIQIGCQLHNFAHWTEHVLAIARANGYTRKQGLEYQKIVAFLVANGVPAAEPLVEETAVALEAK